MSETVTFGELFDALQLLKRFEIKEIPKQEIILRVFNTGTVMYSISTSGRPYRLKSQYLNGRTLKQIPGARLQTDAVRVIVTGQAVSLEYGSSKFSQRIVIPDSYVCEIYTNFRYKLKKAFLDGRQRLVYS